MSTQILYVMKRILLSCLPLLCGGLALGARENAKTASEVTNTVKNRISLQGYVQVGYTCDSRDGEGNTFDLRRVILMASGRITDKLQCHFMYSFANTGKILEAYAEYAFRPEFRVRLGQFKTMYTFENPLSPCDVELINCCSQSVGYLAGVDGSDPLYGAHTGRDLGLMASGDLFGRLLSYNLAAMNGQGINRKDLNSRKDIVGRLTVRPLEWLSAGGSFIIGKGNAAATSDCNPEIGTGDDYTRNRWSAGVTVGTAPADIRAEYLSGKDGHVRSEGYYCTTSVHVLPRLDVIASYDYFDKNKAAADRQTNYVAGLQYWFYPKCRIQAQYTYCDRRKGESYSLIQAQIQVRF